MLIVEQLSNEDVESAIKTYLKDKYGNIELRALIGVKYGVSVRFKTLPTQEEKEPNDQVIEALGSLAKRVSQLEKMVGSIDEYNNDLIDFKNRLEGALLNDSYE